MLIRRNWKRTAAAFLAVGSVSIGGVCAANSDVRDVVYSTSVGAVRFGRAVFTVSRIVFDYEMFQFRTSRLQNPITESEKSEQLSKLHWLSATRLLRLAELNGGCFVKVGQHIAALDYLVPSEYVEVLRVLHSRAPQSKFSDVRYVIEKELKCKLEDVFESFDERPIASASLAQVHKAVLKPKFYQLSGEVAATSKVSTASSADTEKRCVAVKVQHRNVRAYSEIDIQAMSILVRCVSYMFPEFKFEWLVTETRRNLPVELDFRAEAVNCERARQTFSYLRFLHVPRVYSTVSTTRCLVMQYIDGVQIDDTQKLKALGIPTYRVVEKLSQLYAEMIFKHGFVHCDPHPGNIFIVPIYSQESNGAQNGKKNGQRKLVDIQLALLDHGLYQSLSEDFTSLYSRFWHAMMMGNERKIRKCATQMNCDAYFDVLACIVSGRSWKAVQQGVMHSQQDANELFEIREEASKFLVEITQVLDKVPRELLLLLKTNDLLRGIEQKLYGRPLQGQLASERSIQLSQSTRIAEEEVGSLDDGSAPDASTSTAVGRNQTENTDPSLATRVSHFVADEVQERRQTWYITFLYLSRACIRNLRAYKVNRCNCRFAPETSHPRFVQRALLHARRFYCTTYWNVKCFIYTVALQIAEYVVRWQYELGERLYHRVSL